MSAIECTSAGIKDLADGSLRITLEFEPRHAKDAFFLFGTRGTACALVALTQDASKQAAQVEIIQEEKPKGGQLAKLAGMWCNEPSFWKWIELGNQNFVYSNVLDSNTAKYFICSRCGIESRAELDNNPQAADKFHTYIREPYSAYLKTL